MHMLHRIRRSLWLPTAGAALALAAVTGSLPAFGDAPPTAQARGEANDQGLPAFLRTLGDVKLLKRFPTEVRGLTGLAIDANGQPAVVYETEDGYVVVGAVFAPDGRNLTLSYAQAHLPAPPYGDVARELLEHDQDLVWTGRPDAPHTLLVFADPNCIFCKHFWDQMAEPVRQGKVRIGWAFVAFLKPSSAGRAAALMQAQDPLAAIARNEEHFDEAREEGGLPEAPVTPAIRQALDRHAALMRKAQFRGTPSIIAYHREQRTWLGFGGLPPGLDALWQAAADEATTRQAAAGGREGAR